MQDRKEKCMLVIWCYKKNDLIIDGVMISLNFFYPFPYTYYNVPRSALERKYSNLKVQHVEVAPDINY
jgi:hypothetical protein